jgi:hypothetical protein
MCGSSRFNKRWIQSSGLPDATEAVAAAIITLFAYSTCCRNGQTDGDIAKITQWLAIMYDSPGRSETMIEPRGSNERTMTLLIDVRVVVGLLAGWLVRHVHAPRMLV